MRAALLQLALFADGYAGVAVPCAALGALAPSVWMSVDVATGAIAVGCAVLAAGLLALALPALALRFCLPREDRLAVAEPRHHAAENRAQ